MTKFFKEIIEPEFELITKFKIGDNGSMHPDGKINEEYVGPGAASEYPNLNDEDFSGNDHKGYVYAFVFNQKIYKIGETISYLLCWQGGNTVRGNGGIVNMGPKRILIGQGSKPMPSRPNAFDTRNRIGAYFQEGLADSTEKRANQYLREHIMKGNVTLWAKKIEPVFKEEFIAGENQLIKYLDTPVIEKFYLAKYQEMNDGLLPIGNVTKS
tara:strand:+ start:83 stop:718 length:636 start_codon:yes stop_codon:yes gene_type:complete